MHINQIPFLITTSRHIHYHIASVFPSVNGDIIVSTLWALYKLYRKRNFRLTEVLVDGQFVVCKHKLAAMHVNLNCVSKDEHVPEVKRLIWTTKERCRCSFHNTLFTKLSRGLMIGSYQAIKGYERAFSQDHSTGTVDRQERKARPTLRNSFYMYKNGNTRWTRLQEIPASPHVFANNSIPSNDS